MSLPAPEPGLVIWYDFLWQRDADFGQDNGSKTRPCAIVLTRADAGQEIEVLVAPITHAPPPPNATAVEIPHGVKRGLGLDDQRSWIVLDDLNQFRWPGPDLRRSAVGGRFEIGFLPPQFFAKVLATLTARVRRGRPNLVRRTQD